MCKTDKIVGNFVKIGENNIFQNFTYCIPRYPLCVEKGMQH